MNRSFMVWKQIIPQQTKMFLMLELRATNTNKPETIQQDYLLQHIPCRLWSWMQIIWNTPFKDTIDHIMGVVFVHAILTTQHETHYDTTQTTISSIMHGAYVFCGNAMNGTIAHNPKRKTINHPHLWWEVLKVNWMDSNPSSKNIPTMEVESLGTDRIVQCHDLVVVPRSWQLRICPHRMCLHLYITCWALVCPFIAFFRLNILTQRVWPSQD